MKNMVSMKVWIILLFVLGMSSFFFPLGSGTDTTEFNVRLTVSIYEVFPANRTAKVNVIVVLENFPLNATEVYVKMTGNGYPTILCNKSGWQRYQGSKTVSWGLSGFGEMFPYDAYSLSFTLYYVEYVIGNTTYGLGQNWNYIFEGANVYFDGSRASILKDSWDIGSEILERSVNVTLIRKGMSPYFQFLLPILIGQLLVLASTLLERRNVQGRLRIYLSLFVFAPMFSLSIQPFLPYRTTLSFPEFFSVFLMISCGVFSFISLVRIESIVDPRHRTRLILFIDFLGLATSYILYYFLRSEVYGHMLGESISSGAFLIFNLYDYVYLVVIVIRICMGFFDIRGTREIRRSQTLLDRFVR